MHMLPPGEYVLRNTLYNTYAAVPNPNDQEPVKAAAVAVGRDNPRVGHLWTVVLYMNNMYTLQNKTHGTLARSGSNRDYVVSSRILTGRAPEYWTIRPAGEKDWYQIINDRGDRCWALGTNVPGTEVLLDDVVSARSTFWSFRSKDDVDDLLAASSGSLSEETLVHGGIYTIVNERFQTYLDLSVADRNVGGWQANSGWNQEWIFESKGSGWAIRSRARHDTYLGLTRSRPSRFTELVGVDREERVTWIVQLEPGTDNTFRIACEGYEKLNAELNPSGGSNNATKIFLQNQDRNATQQRWVVKQVGVMTVPPATAAQLPVHGKAYFVYNHYDKACMDLDRSDSSICGYVQHGGDNQQWIFENSDNGWIIRSKTQSNLYLGFRPNTGTNRRADGAELTCVGRRDRVVWDIQKAPRNTVRIVCHDTPYMNLELGEAASVNDLPRVHLRKNDPGADQQRWELWLVV